MCIYVAVMGQTVDSLWKILYVYHSNRIRNTFRNTKTHTAVCKTVMARKHDKYLEEWWIDHPLALVLMFS